VVRSVLERFWRALGAGRPVLNHGDLARQNALWHDGHVPCLLDFEFAVIAPVELDANEVLRSVHGPVDDSDQLPDPDGTGRRLLQVSVVQAVVPSLCLAGAADRLLGYAVLLEMYDVEYELKHWDGREDFGTWWPYRRLASLAAGDGGYLGRVLALLP
jgi:scyllo-inosamine 4-kinase